MALDNRVRGFWPSVIPRGTDGNDGKAVVVELVGADTGLEPEPAAVATEPVIGEAARSIARLLAPPKTTRCHRPLRYNPIGIEHDIRAHPQRARSVEI
jgi:hypothetical protein